MTSSEGFSDADAELRDAIRSIDAIGEGASGREGAPPKAGEPAGDRAGRESAGGGSAGDTDGGEPPGGVSDS